MYLLVFDCSGDVVLLLLSAPLPRCRDAAFGETSIGKFRQRILEGSSIIQLRPKDFPDTFEISLDMDHLLLCCLPAGSIAKYWALAKKNID